MNTMRRIMMVMVLIVTLLMVSPVSAWGETLTFLPQVMKVFVFGPNGDNQGTAFLASYNGHRAIIAPYHAWVMAQGAGQPSSVLLIGQINNRRWLSFSKVLVCDPSSDIVLLSVPEQLQSITPLQLTNDLTVGENVYGYGYGMNSSKLNSFSGNVTYIGPEIESLPQWELTFQGFALHGNGVYPGDSGSPLINPNGKVVGETTAVYDSLILASSSVVIAADMLEIKS